MALVLSAPYSYAMEMLLYRVATPHGAKKPMNHVLIFLPGVLYPYLTIEISHVPHGCVHGVAVLHGVLQPRAMGGTAAGCPTPV